MGAVQPGRKAREGTIKKAYCFETDSIEGPFLALEKRARTGGGGIRLHYFCVTEGCAYPIKGATLKKREDYDIAFLVSKPRGTNTPLDHDIDCPYLIGERPPKDPGKGRPKISRSFTEPPPFIVCFRQGCVN